MSDDAIAALRLAGFALAHAAWSIEDGETLCTLAMVDVGGDRVELLRFEADTVANSVDMAEAHLREKLGTGGHAALVIDGYSTTPEVGRTDALLVELFGPGGRSLGKVIQPYRAARRSRIPFVGRATGFAIIGEPMVGEQIQVPDAERLLMDSAREHPHGARLFAAWSDSDG